MKYLAMLILGLFIGALGAVAALNALRQGTPYHDAIMVVLKQQMGALKSMQESDRCDAGEVSRRLDFMAGAAAEVDAAFLPVGDDDRFRELSGNLAKAIAESQGAVPATCAAVKLAMGNIGQHCKACHDVFR